MNDAERVSYLVDILEGGNARAFSEKTSISEQSVSCLRHGKYKLNRFLMRIATAYPDVNIHWLSSGEGEPLRSVSEKGVVLMKLESLEREVRRLSKVIEKMAQGVKCT